MKERITGGDKQHLRRLFSLSNDYLLPIHKILNLDSHSPDVDIVSNTSGKKQMQMWQGSTHEIATGIHRICKRSEIE